MKSRKIDSVFQRIVITGIGLTIAVFILLYSFRFTDFPVQVTMIGQNVTAIFMGVIIVLSGIVAGTLIKSGILGKWKLD